MNDARELDQIQIEIERLHERSQSNKAEIQSHEAVCEERYQNIVNMFKRLETRLDKIDGEVDTIREMATTGRASLKTLLWIGGVTVTVISLLTMILNVFPR
jgi:vacuolar-type H+-ATPase subunit E/Vma4